MTVIADISELERFASRLERVAREGLAVPIVEAVADVWIDEAKRTAPVDTGQLRARIGLQSIGGTEKRADAVIVSDVPYATFVNYGTRYNPPNPYFDRGRTAAERALREIGGRINVSLEAALESGGVFNPRSLL